MLFALTFCTCVAAADARNPDADILGIWKIAAVLDAADVSAMSDRQARSMIGKTVRIAPDRFEFNGTVCQSPSYERRVEDGARHFREKGHVSSANLHLPDPVTVIDAKCTFVYIKRGGRIVIQWDGVYFEAVRQVR
jgi:hypothetical protein